MNLQKVTNKLASWPTDWDRHILQGFRVYFNNLTPVSISHLIDDRLFEVITNPEYSSFGNTIVKIGLSCEGGDSYIAEIKDGLICTVSKCLRLATDDDLLDDDSNIIELRHMLFVVFRIDRFGKFRSAYDVVKKVEKAIVDDYHRGYDGDDGDDYPLIPSPPSGYLVTI